MSEIILHHYPMSPFAEKARLMLGFKALPWRSVLIPSIMPKPDLMPLTGGYRKTPVLQIGADIYCDTALIARLLDRLQPTPALYPAAQAAQLQMTARWADSALFSAAVAYAMQPAGFQHRFKDLPADQLNAFLEDRKAFRKGGSGGLGLPLPQSVAIVENAITWVEEQLSATGAPFLSGATPAIADFSVYHCLWFIQNSGPLAAVFERAPKLQAWLQRMAQIGHGNPEKLKSGDAVDIARAATPQALPATDLRAIDGVGVGDRVTVAATDYGVDPVSGTLVMATTEEIVVAREDERAGKVQVHFPRLGFQFVKPE